jgi:hypothetical protein
MMAEPSVRAARLQPGRRPAETGRDVPRQARPSFRFSIPAIVNDARIQASPTTIAVDSPWDLPARRQQCFLPSQPDQSSKGTTRTSTVLPSVDSRSVSPSKNFRNAA